MTSDTLIVEGIKDLFFRLAVAKGWANSISWGYEALPEVKKNQLWFNFVNIPLQPVNTLKGKIYSGICHMDVLAGVGTLAATIQTAADAILETIPVGGYFYKTQDFCIYQSYKDQQQTDGSYIIQPVLVYYEGFSQLSD